MSSTNPEESAQRFFAELQRLSSVQQREIATDQNSFSAFLFRIGEEAMAEAVSRMAARAFEEFWGVLTDFIDALIEGVARSVEALADRAARFFSSLFE